MYSASDLPWMVPSEKKKLSSIINNTIVENISKRHWGSECSYLKDKSHIFITDYRGLMLAVGTLKYHLNNMNTNVLYRGQVKNYKLKPSLFRNCTRKEHFESNEKWIEDIVKVSSKYFDPIGDNNDREALLQHYGCKTRWIDVVDHVQTALWFAYNSKDDHCGNKHDDSVSYFYLMGYPKNNEDYTIVNDLRLKPSDWLRPHIQQGYSIRAKDPTSYGRSLEHLRISTIIIPRDLLYKWSNSLFLNESHIYPGIAFDKALYYWEKTKEELSKMSIPLNPPI